MFEYFSSSKILGFTTDQNGGIIIFDCVSLGAVVAAKHLGYIRAYVYLVEFAYNRSAFQENDTGNEFFGMFNFLFGPLFNGLGELVIAPVIAHLGVYHILVDNGQLMGQQCI